MRPIKDVRELRAIQMDILDEIHQFCIDHQIVYFLSSGTLIGAVRHGGYIPWDDDIDLYMPRESYERFVKEYIPSSSRFQLLEPRLTKRYIYTFAKVADTRTLMVEAWYDNFPIGINIDIFPVDFVEENENKRKFLFWLKKNLFRIYIDKRMRLFRDQKPWHVFKRLVCRLMPVSAQLLRSWLIRIQYRKSPSSLVCNMTETGPSIKGCFSVEAISGSVDMQFEGKTYKTMVGYKEYLEKTYGDYMTLPPVEKRETHKFEAYFYE